MKTKHPMLTKNPSLLLAAILACVTGAAAAQTSIYYTSGSGAITPPGATFGGTLASIGYDSYQSTNFGPSSDGGTIGTAQYSFGEEFWSNFTISGLPATSGGGALTSVTFYLWAEDAVPVNTTQTINIMDGLDGNGTQVGSFVHDDTFNPQWFSFTVSAATLAGGFSFDSTVLDGTLNVSTEMNDTITQTPLIVANYLAVPEPSAALLGVLGALGFLRRRRA